MKENIRKMASVMLSNLEYVKFINYTTQKRYNTARLLIEKPLMTLEEEREQLYAASYDTSYIDFQIECYNRIISYIINLIENDIDERKENEGESIGRLIGYKT